MFFFICFVSHGVEQDAENRIKNIISSGSYEFLNLAHNTIITIYTQTSNRGITNDLRNIFEKTIHGRGPKLGSYVPLMFFNKLKSGIVKKIFFNNAIYWQKCMHASLILAIFGTFLPIKIKIYIFVSRKMFLKSF